MSGEQFTQLAGQVIDVTEQGLGLFEVWPLNIVVVGGIIAMGIALVAKFMPKAKKR